jgi:hypothetical protein
MCVLGAAEEPSSPPYINYNTLNLIPSSKSSIFKVSTPQQRFLSVQDTEVLNAEVFSPSLSESSIKGRTQEQTRLLTLLKTYLKNASNYPSEPGNSSS